MGGFWFQAAYASGISLFMLINVPSNSLNQRASKWISYSVTDTAFTKNSWLE